MKALLLSALLLTSLASSAKADDCFDRLKNSENTIDNSASLYATSGYLQISERQNRLSEDAIAIIVGLSALQRNQPTTSKQNMLLRDLCSLRSLDQKSIQDLLQSIEP